MHWLLALISRSWFGEVLPSPLSVQYRIACDAIDWIFKDGQPPYFVSAYKQDDVEETLFDTTNNTYNYIMPPELGVFH
jgi:hypothetical protein